MELRYQINVAGTLLMTARYITDVDALVQEKLSLGHTVDIHDTANKTLHTFNSIPKFREWFSRIGG